MSEPVSAELAVPEHLLDVISGEVLPANVENAGRVIAACREMGRRIAEVKAAATYFLEERSRVEGTKTFRVGDESIVLTGGTSIQYDPEDLIEALREAGCPEDRINEAVVPEVTYKVNRSVLRQLVAANPDYAAAAELAARQIETPVRVSVKRA